jgi:hypothetical protein
LTVLLSAEVFSVAAFVARARAAPLRVLVVDALAVVLAIAHALVVVVVEQTLVVVGQLGFVEAFDELGVAVRAVVCVQVIVFVATAHSVIEDFFFFEKMSVKFFT